MRSRRWLSMVLGLGGVLILPTVGSAGDEASQGETTPGIQKGSNEMTLTTKPGESATITVRKDSATATKMNADGKTTSETLKRSRKSEMRIVTKLEAPAVNLPKLVPVYFQTDSAEIQAISLPLLDATAAALKGNPQIAVAIQGHADERGSHEYNADLTERRAFAVSEALQERGVPVARLLPSGYGTDSPLCLTSNEDCWSQNRRVDIVPTAAGG